MRNLETEDAAPSAVSYVADDLEVQETAPDAQVPVATVQPAQVLAALALPKMQERFAYNIKRYYEEGRMDEGLARHLGIEFTVLKPGFIQATMPVDQRTCRYCNPVNILNGGASLALAENAAGLGSMLLCKKGSHPCGIQVTANHLRMITVDHVLTAQSFLVHLGSAIHIWDTNLLDERQRIISSVRVTNMIVASNTIHK